VGKDTDLPRVDTYRGAVYNSWHAMRWANALYVSGEWPPCHEQSPCGPTGRTSTRESWWRGTTPEGPERAGARPS